ncbi:2-amino-4-hydroxy-6-hydroxymethyldihydropteridine diphosphokinase [Neobacillus thermocopriae]|uniref:2-amino-4-hydroxy-6-hydroxymethyldihydropteridine diphosphokinase n=1 Tax=Neobacillus thermocopriae TaxID=1215031 RepID=A0A6B3TVH2_9BACI|nr:2-amino-4-hydroxy-6-hydroxymethyldihydropteridine diphosphokinase [Neobacillus thermocopriae]MED3625270.1 2-amino-4-hydroxy-6-hydroxymethyldihydropteridine diphosphokinase [Neobacillus thermocopriae]MED3714584.1 2-amino-4-hydroxy-6-hydroxymethyldihydropteridine diphosphokinase [Neobacillus thermocopriae]NEX79951.1 2-amino-4-hydroxy-6-hydroxymethyldihydropteridine diphosphokinase [Neobacillus thermocopriae]
MGNKALIALGSNMGNRYDNILTAIKCLIKDEDIQLVNFSSLYETDPVGYEEQDLFLNMVIEVNTALEAMELLDRCLTIETELGRKREIKWGPRTIDLDILTYNQENMKTKNLTIPHPRMLQRAFVLIPLYEINPDFQLSGMDKSLEEWINELPDKEGVRVWKRINWEDVFEPIEN